MPNKRSYPKQISLVEQTMFKFIPKYIPRLVGLLILSSMGSKVQAQTVENNVTSESQPNQEQTLDNDQNNAASINQTGIYNIGDSATYKIQGLGGRNVVCPRPSFIVGSGFNSSNGINFGDNSSYALNASFIVPLGGDLGKTCEGMANTISRKTQYDLEIINARSCSELLNAGIQLSAGNFPTLAEVCQGVSLSKSQANSPQKVERRQSPTLPTLPKKSEVDSGRETKQMKPEPLRDELNQAPAEIKEELPSPILSSLPQKNEVNGAPKQLALVSFQDNINEYIALDPENVQLTSHTRLVLVEAE